MMKLYISTIDVKYKFRLDYDENHELYCRFTDFGELISFLDETQSIDSKIFKQYGPVLPYYELLAEAEYCDGMVAKLKELYPEEFI